MRHLSLSSVVLALAMFVGLAGASPAHAYPLLSGLGGPAGYGIHSLPTGSQLSSSAIDLSLVFPGGLVFYGQRYTQVYVNNNGTITFPAPESDWGSTTMPYPAAQSPMIAPYWSAVDTGGIVLHNHAPGAQMVYWDIRPGQLVVTWHDVGYFYGYDDRHMDFQLIIRSPAGCASGNFEVEFRYNKCEWLTPLQINGAPYPYSAFPFAGFDAADRSRFVALPDSGTSAVLNLCTNSNASMSGLWRFNIRDGEINGAGGDTCSDSGTRCTVPGVSGVCSVGVTQCVGSTSECRSIGLPGAEVCDGIDNDCNSVIDDDAPCPTPMVCADGMCASPCFEHSCRDGETCNSDGICVATECVGVTCPLPGQSCVEGSCIDACTGVTCPHGQNCVDGRCVDLCSVLSCGAGKVCQDGTCIEACPCHPCASDEMCGLDGRCRPAACDGITCSPGAYCGADGHCISACEGAVCPTAQHCAHGHCVRDPSTQHDAGMEAPDAGSVDGSAKDAGVLRHLEQGGCCRVDGTVGSTKPGVLVLLVLGMVAVTRRRSR